MDRQSHWEAVYLSKDETEVSWHQGEPTLSLELIREVCVPGGRVIDVGGGASRLVDRLIASGFKRPAVLDVSQAALDRAISRLGSEARNAEWINADVTEMPALEKFDLWHDRAVFHFLTDPGNRRKYVELAIRTISAGGHLILATFALDGPSRCSGLDVCRYDASLASMELGSAFRLVRECRDTHITPTGKQQQFFYGVFERV